MLGLLLVTAALAGACEGANIAPLPPDVGDTGWPGEDSWSWGGDEYPDAIRADAEVVDSDVGDLGDIRDVGDIGDVGQPWPTRAALVTEEVRAILEPYDPPWPDPEIVAQNVLEDDGLIRQEIRFTTFDGLRASGVIVRPDDGDVHAGLLLLHGHDSSAERMTTDNDSYCRGLGLALAREGFVTLSPDVRSFGDFRPGDLNHWGANSYPDQVREDGDIYLRLAVNDARVALSVLREAPGVDRERLGMGGISLGSLLTLIAAAVEPDVDAIVLSGLFLPFDVLFSDKHHDCQHLKPLADVTTADELAALVLPGAIQVHWGEEDEFYERDGGADVVEALERRAAALGYTDHVEVQFTEDAGHAFDPPVHADFFLRALADPSARHEAVAP